MTIQRVGITGAAGNIGSTLRACLEKSYTLELYDRVPIRNTRHPSKVIDFSIKDQVSGAFDGLDVLIHLAGNPSPAAPASDTIRNNFLATSLVFEEARTAHLKKVIFASSNFYHEGDIVAMMQGNRTELITLDTNPTPLSMYGKSKLFGEQLGLHLAHLGISFAALRIGWTVPQDSPLPYDSPYMRAMFCSKRDLCQIVLNAIDFDKPFVIGFGISNNTTRVFDLYETTKKLGFHPQDNSADY
ncbi:NAD(P)-dependent oxidoreductase [bacterium]|nr:NAD(P)-dependent oxidoreductase [bacterium]